MDRSASIRVVRSEGFAMGLVGRGGGVVVLVLALAGVAPPLAQAAPPVNDGADDAVVVPALPYTATVDLSEATVDSDDAALDASCGVETTASVWFRLAPGYDTALGYRETDDGVRVDVSSGTPGALQPLACSGDLIDAVRLDGGTTYFIRASVQGAALPPGDHAVELLDQACDGIGGDDFDGDSCPDLAVGMPAATVDDVSGAGRVEIAYGNDYNAFDKRRQRIAPPLLGVPLQPGEGFGAALAHGFLDDDWLADLAIGIPRLDVGTAQDAGAVLVLFGSPLGLGGERQALLRQGSVPGSGAREAGDQFGWSLDIEDHQLVVGAPGEDLGAVANAGAVVTYSGFTSAGGPPAGRVISQAGAVAGRAEAGDQFGYAVAFGPLGMLVIGAPGEDVGSLNSAGAVVTITRNGTSAITTQDSVGMAGAAEGGDRLGTALAYLPDPFDDGYRLAVGAPGEDIGAIRDAGLVNFLLASARTSAPRPQSWAVGQDTAGVPGAAEPGDRFGSVLATWSGFHAIDLLVGVPDEDVGTATDAGAVTAIHLEWVGSRFQPVLGRALTQGTPGVTGTPESWDRLGDALSTTGANPDDDDGAYDTVYAGAPGEDAGGVIDVGYVQALTSPFTTVSSMQRLPGQRFGATLSRPW